jgi:hypothetical protein
METFYGDRRVSVPVESGESVDVQAGGIADDWNLFVEYVTTSPGTRETPPEPSERFLGAVDEPGAANVLIRWAIDERNKELAEQEKAEAKSMGSGPHIAGFPVSFDRSVPHDELFAERVVEQWSEVVTSYGHEVELMSAGSVDYNRAFAVVQVDDKPFLLTLGEGDQIRTEELDAGAWPLRSGCIYCGTAIDTSAVRTPWEDPFGNDECYKAPSRSNGTLGDHRPGVILRKPKPTTTKELLAGSVAPPLVDIPVIPNQI